MGIDRRDRQSHRRTIIEMLETTPTSVPRPGPAAPSREVPELDFDWRPRPMEKVVEGRRSFRWPILFAAVVLGVLALIGVQFLITVPQSKADERRVEYRAALDAFETALDGLSNASSPSNPQAMATFATAVHELGTITRASLPGVIPLLPVGPIEELRPARSEMLRIVDAAEAMVASLGSAAAYREAAAGILALPLLPRAAPAELIDPAARAIADMVSDTERNYARLDDDPAFAAYRDRVATVIGGLSAWSDRYLLALRRGDADGTGTALIDIQAQVALVNAELEAAVADRDAAARSTITALRASLAEARVKLA